MEIKPPKWIPQKCPQCQSKNIKGIMRGIRKYIECEECGFKKRIVAGEKK